MMEVVRKYDGLPFRYGLDCCQFVGECLESLNGHNPMIAFNYRDRREADKIINSYGSLLDAVTATLGEPTGTGADGDVALFDQPDGSQIVGIVHRGRVLVRAPAGLVMWDVGAASALWSI